LYGGGEVPSPAEESSLVRMEKILGAILLSGVLASVSLIAAGYLWRWLRTGQLQLEYALPGSNLYQFWVNDMRQAVQGTFRPRLLINLGIALLMATPYARVFFSFVHFAFVQKNLKYSFFTLFVFGGLTYSLFF